ncbi:hypothetical protein COCSADRAFT_134360 [Bipolaris sorokiniana ND90Pr]|uniref:Uncharacterized protein n=1 Tax=Cochliobolus sativus (strain ND90Pr / ATCC 201652) TaxID=665912 RepID=M2TH20_COCSN|nr:uncharacterized protein COCSADRAFT_134360 [Bipolaris sorokiniana ND90Pr]EMD68526.1 hypothetical protein COCSADRAFT_134360 [Bipolaris sorokiniana ND90Pr]
MSVAFSIILVLFTIAMIRFQTAAPVMASYSAAISIACHTPSGQKHNSLISGLQWEVIGYCIYGFGHSKFSKGLVIQPQHGIPYGGRTLARL